MHWRYQKWGSEARALSPFDFQLVFVIDVDTRSSVNFGERHFCPIIHVWKISKMPEFYMIFDRKIFPRFWCGGDQMPSTLPCPRLWILCAITLRPLPYFIWDWDSTPHSRTKSWRRHWAYIRAHAGLHVVVRAAVNHNHCATDGRRISDNSCSAANRELIICGRMHSSSHLSVPWRRFSWLTTALSCLLTWVSLAN